MGITPSIHGFVVIIGPENNPNYFTGTSYSAFLNDAKVFRTVRGANAAAAYWQNADHNSHPLPPLWWKEHRVSPVILYFGKMVDALLAAHNAMALAIAFCNRGPRPDKIGEPPPAKNWANMCSEISAELAKADQIVLAALPDG